MTILNFMGFFVWIIYRNITFDIIWLILWYTGVYLILRLVQINWNFCWIMSTKFGYNKFKLILKLWQMSSYFVIGPRIFKRTDILKGILAKCVRKRQISLFVDWNSKNNRLYLTNVFIIHYWHILHVLIVKFRGL